MDRIHICIVAAFLASALAASPARCEVMEGSIEVSPLFGVLFGPRAGYDAELVQKLAAQDREPWRFAIRDNMAFGGYIGYNLVKYFGIEGMFGYSINEFEQTTDGVTRKFDLNVMTVGANALFHLNPQEAVVLYATAGVGLVQWDFGNEVEPSAGADPWAVDKSGLAYSYGGGVKLGVSSDMHIRIEARDIVGKLRLQSNELLQEAGLPPAVRIMDDRLHNLVLWGGATFNFGR